MLADYRETGLSVGTHPLALLRPHLPRGTLSSPELHEARHGSTVAFAGMAIARQRPATAKGIVFMLLEDEHGQVNLIVPKDVYERHRGIVRVEPIVLVRGRYERVERNRNVLVRELESLSPLARRVAASPGRRGRSPARSPLRAPLTRTLGVPSGRAAAEVPAHARPRAQATIAARRSACFPATRSIPPSVTWYPTKCSPGADGCSSTWTSGTPASSRTPR